MLQVSVIVQSRTLDGKDVREKTQTVVVNAHGGLLKLQMEVKVGQPILLINENPRLDIPPSPLSLTSPLPSFGLLCFRLPIGARPPNSAKPTAATIAKRKGYIQGISVFTFGGLCRCYLRGF